MQIIKTVSDMQVLSKRFRSEGKGIGFVPTMGAIHEGHLSLIRRSKAENDETVVSIFVNPAQFGPNEDFLDYPREVEKDLENLSVQDVNAIFIPDEREIYPEGFSASINIGRIGEILCGASRPGHFNGVATVVAKLFHIVMPERAYFGQKDFQQTVVIRDMVSRLNFDIDIRVCPTVREDDGLAVSSRNRYLDPQSRAKAAILFQALLVGEELIQAQEIDDVSRIRKAVERVIRSEPALIPEYVEIVDPVSLMRIRRIGDKAVILLAVRIGNTRLIDNVFVEKR